MTNLSSHFPEWEFLQSDTATEHKLNNTWDLSSHKKNAVMLCQLYLEPIRLAAKSPLIVTSGYRSKKLNALIPGSSNTSDHSNGLAVDLKGKDISLPDLFDLIILLNKKGLIPNFDQLIWEYDSWVHLGVGFRRRMQIERKEKGKDYYLITKAPR